MGDTKRLTTEIEIKALISSAERDLKAFKESLDSMWKSGEPPKGLLRTFEGLRQRLQSLRQFSDQGVLDLSELKTAKADYEAYTKAIRQLMVEFKLLTEEQKLAMLGREEQETIKKREDAIKAYTKELQKNTEEKRRNASVIQEKKKTTEEKQTLLNTKEQELEAIPQETRKAAEAYQKRLEEIAAINAKIKEQEELIDKYRKQGLSENPKSKNKLTASIDRYSELMFQRQQLGNPETEDPNGKVAFEQYSALFSTVTSLRAEIKSLNEEMETLGDGDKAIDARTTKKFEELKETLKSLGVEGAESAESLEDLEKIVQQLKSGAIQGLDGEIEQVERELESMGKTAGETGDRIEEAFDKLNNKKDHDQQVKNLQEKIKQFLGLQGAVELMRRAMSNAFSTIKDLDSAMKEMAVVTDLSVGDYWGQLPEYAARASELGVSIKSAYEAATLYYQQGLKANEVTELSAQTLKMASIAGIDAAEATNKMTAALRGFNMELNEASAQRVADVYSELAAITAADVGQISSAMTKTASIASSAGMEFETTAAFLSQIIETTQESAETAGTAMKTVIARFQELKKAPSEIGEVDGEIVDANAIETALRSVGVSLRDANGQFRELDDVFLELSSKWSGLDKNTQRYIATIAAGSRQQSRFIAMMSDYGRTQELVSAANNSAGASAKQYEKTLESLEAKLNKLKNAWDQFTMGIMNSDLVKIGIDVLTKFLEIINKSTSALDGVAGSFSKIVSVLGIFKLGQKLFEKFRQPMIQFFADVVKEAGKTGEQATQAMVDGAKKGKKTTLGAPQGTEESRTVGGLLGKATGLTDLVGGLGRLGKQRKNKKAITSRLKEKRGKVADTESSLQLAMAAGDAEGVKELKEELGVYKEQLKSAEQEQQEFLKESEGAWQQVTQGISQAGSALVGVGTGISMLGGYLQELGLEEFGEGLSWAGQVITIVGGALMAIPPIISLINAGLLTPPLGIITGILSIILVSLIAIYAIIKNDKATQNLQKAAEAAEKAAETAEEAKEAYQDLADSLDDLGNKYQALEELTKGTREWNDAIQGINDSVVELISKYPELAKFVERKDAVLTIDVNSKGVQDIIDKYNNQAIISQSVALGAQINQKEAQKVLASRRDRFVDYSELELNLGKALKEGVIHKDAFGFYKITKGAEGVAKTLGITEETLNENFNLLVTDGEKLAQVATELNNLNEQISAVAEAMIVQAQQIANMSYFSEEQRMQAYNLTNEEDILRYKKLLDQKYADDDSDLTEEKLKQYMESLAGVQRVENIRDKKIVYFDTAGERHVVDKETYLEQMKSAEATKMAANAMEITPKLIDSIVQKTGLSAIEKATKDKSGSLLTEEEAKSLTGEEAVKKLKKVWEGFIDEEKELFGTYEEYLETFQNAAADIVSKFDSLDIKMGLLNDKLEPNNKIELPENLEIGVAENMLDRLQNVFKLSGTTGLTSVASSYNALLAGKTEEEEKKKIVGLLSQADWGSLESLNKLQIQLSEIYEENTTEIGSLITAMGNASYAISDLSSASNQLNELWKAMKNLEFSESSLTELQWKFQKALSGFGEQSVKALGEALKTEYVEVFDSYAEMYKVSSRYLAEYYAKGENFETNFTNALEIGQEGLSINYSELEKLRDMGLGDEFETWFADVKQHYDSQQEAIEGMRESVDNIDQLAQDSKDAFYNVRDTVKNTIIDNAQKQIELQQQTLDATKEASSAITSKIKEQIDHAREERQKEESKNNISDLYSQMAYLVSSSDGSNAMAVLDIQKQIKEAERDYQDTLIDQSLQSLEDSNEKAHQQRERQILLAEQQLEAYTSSKEFQDDVDQGTNELLNADNWEQTAIGQMIKEALIEGLSEEEQKAILDEFGRSIEYAALYDEALYTTISIKMAEIPTIAKNTAELVELVEGLVAERQRKELRESGFEENVNLLFTSGGLIANGNQDRVSNLLTFARRETMSDEDMADYLGSARAIASARGDTSLKTKEQYYQEVFERSEAADFDPETMPTYGEYLQNYTTSGKSDIRADFDNLKNMTLDEALKLRETFQNTGVISVIGGPEVFDEELFRLAPTLLANTNENGDPTKKKEWIGVSIPLGPDLALNGPASPSSVQVGDIVPDYPVYTEYVNKTDAEALENLIGDGNVHMVYAKKGEEDWGLYVRRTTTSKEWHKIVDRPGNEVASLGYEEAMRNASYHARLRAGLLKSYKTGGLADFTGPAWLDGTPSKPEYILNAKQTERFFSLIDVLESVDRGDERATSSGDNYFDIAINVERLDNDYDVEKVADKIRRMICEDATYRNVNTINKIR